jgi:hypothetical protein
MNVADVAVTFRRRESTWRPPAERRQIRQTLRATERRRESAAGTLNLPLVILPLVILPQVILVILPPPFATG